MHDMESLERQNVVVVVVSSAGRVLEDADDAWIGKKVVSSYWMNERVHLLAQGACQTEE